MPDLAWDKSRPRPRWFDRPTHCKLRQRRHEYARMCYEAQPRWVDPGAIRAVYREARRRGMTVDHLVPLKHPHVCGLHCPENMRLLPLQENVARGNRRWPDMWHEQVDMLPSTVPPWQLSLVVE